MARRLSITAPAKVNLYLGVGDARPDGYHAVSTILQTLELCDEIELSEAEERSLVCEPDLGLPQEENLAWRAADAFMEHVADVGPVAIVVRKRIPHGAGLGGGSSDAAGVLAGLAHLAGVELGDPRLIEAAKSLGADTTFFLTGGTALFAGRGDDFVRRLPGIDAEVVLVKPEAPVSTADAYRAFDADPQVPAGPEAVSASLVARDAGVLGNALANNMEKAASSLVPQVADALRWLSAQDGVVGVALAGSGSCCFGLCESAQAASLAAESAAEQGLWSASTRFRNAGVRVLEG